MNVEKVDDFAEADAIGEIANRATEHHAQGRRGQDFVVFKFSVENQQQTDRNNRRADKKGHALFEGTVREEAERTAAIAHVGEVEETGDHFNAIGVVNFGVDHGFRNLVKRIHDE